MDPGTILVVDDDANLRSALDSILGSLGYRVITAATGEAAYALLETQPVDAVLVDIRMPEMSGLSLYLAMLHRHPHLKGRIAVITADADADDVRGWLAAHQCTVFRKPFRAQPVIDWLRLALERRDERVSGT